MKILRKKIVKMITKQANEKARAKRKLSTFAVEEQIFGEILLERKKR